MKCEGPYIKMKSDGQSISANPSRITGYAIPAADNASVSKGDCARMVIANPGRINGNAMPAARDVFVIKYTGMRVDDQSQTWQDDWT